MTEPWWDIIPRKREAADVLLCDESGRPMIVQNSWNDAWTLPGGALNHGEPPRRGAEREIQEELPANLARRLRAGVTAKRDATTLYLENGYQR